jgi:translocation and assembly module TamB
VPGREALAQYSSQQVVIRDLELARNDSRIRVNGVLGTAAATASPLVVNVERVPLEDVATLLLSTQKLTGQLDGTARITGEVKTPRIDADVTVVNGSVNGVPFESLSGTVNYSGRELGMNVKLEAGTSGRLTAEGTMPIGASEDPSAPAYNLRIASEAINLALFQPLATHLEQLQGTGNFDLKVLGPASAPGAHGVAGITGASFTMAVTGVRYPRLDAKVTAEGDVLKVQQFELHDLDGHIANVAGTLKIAERGTPSEFNLRLLAKDFHILRNQFGDLSFSPDLRFSGDLQSPLVVGTIVVERGRLEVSDILERFAATGYKKVETTSLEQVAEVTTQGPTAGASFSIALDIPDNLVLRGRDMRGPRGSIGLGDVNITLGGSVAIAKDPTGPVTLVGGLQVARGSYSFQGRRFTILPESTIHFRGAELLDPSVDVRAERQIGGVTANVHVTGTAREPQIALSSSPPLDQGDILSLIVFNTTMNQLPTAQRTSLATRAGTLAARALATPIADSVARALDFDLFEIAPTEDVSGGAILTIGRQISDRLFVGFRQEFGPDDSSQVSFEYRLSQFLKFVTSFSQGTERDRSGLRAERAAGDFIFVIRR